MPPIKQRKSKTQTNNCVRVSQHQIPIQGLHLASFKQIFSRFKCNLFRKIEGNHFLCNHEARNPEQIRRLIKTICQKIRTKKLRNINVLKISFERIFEMTSKHFKGVISMIAENFSQLQKLDLDLDDYIEMDEESLPELAVQLGRKLMSLNYLKLDFWKWNNISHRGLKLFGKEISKALVHVTDLCIDFNCQFFNSYRKNHVRKLLLFKIERYMINLVHLNIDFTHRTNITNKEMGELAYQISRNAIAKLQTLTLCFQYQEVPDENLHGLMRTLCTKLTHLKHLSLKINYVNPLNSACLWLALKEISQHSFLESFKFNFRLRNEKRNENKAILFQPSKSLKKLDLTIEEETNSNKNFLSLLSNRIVQNFGNLEHSRILIDFRPFFKLNTQSIEALIFGVCSSLPHLKTHWIELIGDSVLGNWQKDPIYRTQRLRLSLRHLTLIFRINSGYTSNWLEALGERMVFYLSGLLSLSLQFAGPPIDPARLEILGAIISQSLIHLKSFTIVTPNSNEIEKSFQKMFKVVPNLEIKDRTDDF